MGKKKPKGVILNQTMKDELKKLGLKPSDFLKIKSSGMGDHWKI